MSTSKIGITGDMGYLHALIDIYGPEASMRTVWEGEQRRLAATRVVAVIPSLDIQEKCTAALDTDELGNK
jgi:hypothetical protein